MFAPEIRVELAARPEIWLPGVPRFVLLAQSARPVAGHEEAKTVVRLDRIVPSPGSDAHAPLVPIEMPRGARGATTRSPVRLYFVNGRATGLATIRYLARWRATRHFARKRHCPSAISHGKLPGRRDGVFFLTDKI